MFVFAPMQSFGDNHILSPGHRFGGPFFERDHEDDCALKHTFLFALRRRASHSIGWAKPKSGRSIHLDDFRGWNGCFSNKANPTQIAKCVVTSCELVAKELDPISV